MNEYHGNNLGFRIDAEANRLHVIRRTDRGTWVDTGDSEPLPIAIEEYVKQYLLKNHWDNLRVVAWSDLMCNNRQGYAELFGSVVMTQ